MKFIVLSIVLFSALVLNSCAGLRDRESESGPAPTVYSTGWYMGENLSSEYITYSKTEIVPLLPEKKENGPTLEFFMDTLDILEEADGKLLRQTLYGGKTCQEYVENVYNRVTGDYKKRKDDAADASGAAYNWSYSETFDGAVYPSLLVISRRIYNYTGGANGQNERIFFVLDTKLSSKVALNDILAEGAEKDIQARIDDDLRARYRAAPGAPLTSAGFLNDTAGVPQNFFISREGLGFCWNPYEIAPHSMGTLEVVLPYAQIENLLNDRGREMFKSL
ncbi:MAG: RsiV family protein [Spirochaetaceae bacterium]|nr:RsiV family protein [Spirochaetaceae bacterium]